MAEKSRLRVINLLSTELCNGCRFRSQAKFLNERGEVVDMMHCKRLDCDNWDNSSTEAVELLKIIDD